jgi:mannose-6-phosphate isomerase
MEFVSSATNPMNIPAFSLKPILLEKVWGSTSLGPWFPNSEKKIGEAWYSSESNRTSLGPTLGELIDAHGARLLGDQVEQKGFPLLVKLIFTSENLSVQVHPEDDFAEEHENSRGKTEMWHFLRAAKDASIAAGLREQVSAERLREASKSGEIEGMLNWIGVSRGDSIFIPAGTIHAIGAGLVLCEIQQNSDITYRLYDYGRPRELHLEKGVSVSYRGPHPGLAKSVPLSNGVSLLAECQYFRTELHLLRSRSLFNPSGRSFQIFVVTHGSGVINGAPAKCGDVWILPALSEDLTINPEGEMEVLLSRLPG